MITIRKFVRAFPDHIKIRIIRDYELLETQSTIGDCALRAAANDWADQAGLSTAQTLLAMELVAKECFRYFAELYFESQFLKTANSD